MAFDDGKACIVEKRQSRLGARNCRDQEAKCRYVNPAPGADGLIGKTSNTGFPTTASSG